VIRSIRHKGLRRLHEDDDPRGVFAEHVEKLRDILARLDAARDVSDMDLPGFRLHPSKVIEKDSGLSPFARIGELFFDSRTSTYLTSTMPITTEGV
jgi:plasmid maintenance system killer protein